MVNNQSKQIIDVARQFTVQPWGRYEKDDIERSAEVFRKEFLVPALKAGVPFVVELSNSNRYNSSFLEEAFGGLVRSEGFISKDILAIMEVRHTLLPSIVDEIIDYIKSAVPLKEGD